MSLSPDAARLFDYLPRSYGLEPDDCDPIVARWLEALAFEIERLRQVLLAIRSTSIPSRADDTLGQLSRWEAALGLPVAPADATTGQRVAKLVGTLQGRRVASGHGWTSAMDASINAPGQWRAYENTPGPNELTIEIPFAAGSYNAGQVEALARRRSPANQLIHMRYTQGFLVGISRVGDEL